MFKHLYLKSYVLKYISFIFLITLFCFFFMPFCILKSFTWPITLHPLIHSDYSSIPHYVFPHFILFWQFNLVFSTCLWVFLLENECFYSVLTHESKLWLHLMNEARAPCHLECDHKWIKKFHASAPNWSRKDNLFLCASCSPRCTSM